ncbi:MAG TPA: DUF499 domain-containing protein, partial [bacterium]|nr:DUF499 domain-containing protein [bacterium]
KEGADEYKDPVEFFHRTYLTDSLKRLLVGAAQRLSGAGGDPVIQLQTNFGGGKTHSMLALLHLFSGTPPTQLLGVDALLAESKLKSLPAAKRVVLVGNRISPGNPVTKADGTVVRTMWGELAWQLGGRKAYNRIAQDDEKATCPGDVLRQLLNEHGPVLILIDEWVAYATQGQDPRAAIKWEAIRLTGQDGLAERASKVDPEVLLNAVRGGQALLTWERDSFAYAERFDAAEGRYQALSCGQHVPLAGHDAPGLLVKSELARAQMDAETKDAAATPEAQTVVGTGASAQPAAKSGAIGIVESPKPKRFHATAVLDPARAGRDASVIADEVISHLTALVGATMTVTLEIEAEVPK